MKKFYLYLVIFIVTHSLSAQILGYGDLGVLLSSNDYQTTARTMGMKNAFGALGGDLSSINVNPAGLAVINQSMASLTLGSIDNNTTSNFYGTLSDSNDSNLNFSQIGTAFYFNHSRDMKWVAGINYQLHNSFRNSWISTGNSGIPTWEENYFNSNDANLYNQVNFQDYTNITSGKQSVLNLAIASVKDNSFYLGGSINAYNFNFIEDATRFEDAEDISGAYVEAFESFWQEVRGEGISFSFGFIVKPIHSLRLGLAYETPVFYTIHEESNMFAEDNNDFTGYYDVYYSVDPPAYTNNNSKVNAYDYDLRIPSKLTGSAALVLGQDGLISIDLISQNYQKLHLNPSNDFSDENYLFNSELKKILTVNVGGEWRIDDFSIRGGYSFADSPYETSLESDNLTGYSLGAGYNWGNFAVDIAYDHTEKTDYYNYYSDLSNSNINGADLTRKKDKVLATLTFKF